MQALSSPSGTPKLFDDLICPVTLDPLSTAVTLVPCAHKIQQVAAETMYGATNGGWLVQSDKPCPVCRASVLGYMVDHSTRSIVNILFGLSEDQLKPILDQIKNLPKNSLTVSKDEVEKMPYPGKPARFFHTGGDWTYYNSGGELCRRLVFESDTRGSLFKKFYLLGYRDGDVRISLKCSRKFPDLKNYSKNFNLKLEHETITTKSKEQLAILYSILSENNEIPDSHFNMIKNIVAQALA